ncbi:MAG: hypothetical protein ACTHZ9_09235 [Leucobacter sp.]
MLRTKIYTRVLAATFAVAVSVTLVGCFSNPFDALTDRVAEGTAQEGAEELVEGLTGEGLDMEFGEMPADFPSEVPLVSDKVLNSASISGEDGKKITSVIVVDPRSPSEVAEEVKADFADWEEIMASDMGGEMYTLQYEKDTLRVIIGVLPGPEDEGSAVSYAVHPK